MAIIGDSITFLDQGEMQKQLSPEFKLNVSATLGITLGQSMAAAQALSATNPNQGIIDLGSNDVLSPVPISQAIADLNAIVATFRETHCTHLVDLNTHMVAIDRGSVGVEAKQLNDEMHKLAKANSAIDIFGWDKIISDDIAAHPPNGTLTADTVHPGPQAQKLLADELDTVLHRCWTPLAILVISDTPSARGLIGAPGEALTPRRRRCVVSDGCTVGLPSRWRLLSRGR